MRAPAALLVLTLAACSGSAAVPTRVPDSVPSASPSVHADASVESTACRQPRDPIAAPAGASITAAIALGCEGGGVAVSGGSVWVVPHLDRVVLRIDPATRKVVDRIPLGDRGPGAEIDAADDMVWASVSSPSYDPERLVRLDPTSGSVVAWVDAAAWSPVIGAGFIWARSARGIHRIDPRTNSVGAVVDAGDCGIIAFNDRVFCIGAESVVSIDPTTDTVKPIAGAPTLGWPVETVGGLIWGVNGDSLWAFDPETGKVRVALEAPEGVAMWGLDAVVLDESLWMAASSRRGDPTRTAPDRLVRIDPVKMVIDCVLKTPNPEYGMAAGFGSVWFSVLRQPWLLRIDPAC
jgi:hypothetical protein